MLMIKCKHARKYIPATPMQVLAVARNMIQEVMPSGTPMNHPDNVTDYLRLRLSGLEREVFIVMHLNSRLQLIAVEEAAVGSLAACAVYPREIVKSALRYNSAAVIFAHNHPSGSPQPSAEDRLLTERLSIALKTVDIRVCDHVVVAGDRVVSMAMLGMM